MRINKIATGLMTFSLCAALVTLAAAQGRGRVGGAVGGAVGGIGTGAGVGAGAGAGAGVGPVGVGSHATANTGVSARADAMNRSQPSVALANNTQLASRTQALLPAGETIQQASAGFKNTGQFLAAVHVSNNLGIPFAQLKARTTGSQSVSLGKAIHELRSDVDSKAEEKKAKAQANADLEAEAAAQAK